MSGVVRPSLRRSCCCAGSASAGGDGSRSGGPFALSERSPFYVPASALSTGEGLDGWRRSPTAGRDYRVPSNLYREFSRYTVDPVFVQSRCGTDRDCTPDDRVVTSYAVAERGAFAWIAKGNSRFVNILSEPGRVLLRRFDAVSADYVNFTATSRDEFEMRAIQKSPNAGRFGFLPE